MDSWFREIHVPRAWRVYLATGFDFREKNRACFGSIGVHKLASVSYLAWLLIGCGKKLKITRKFLAILCGNMR